MSSPAQESLLTSYWLVRARTYDRPVASFQSQSSRSLGQLRLRGGLLAWAAEVDPDLVVPDEDLSLDDGAVAPWAQISSEYFGRVLTALAAWFLMSWVLLGSMIVAALAQIVRASCARH